MTNLMNDKKVVFGAVGLVVVLFLTIVGMIAFKSQTAPPQKAPANNTVVKQVQKVDMESQPDWVKNLVVTVTPGYSANSLPNVTVKVSGIAAEAKQVEYVLQYQTSNKGSQGALSTKPLELAGDGTWKKTIDLGTCSTKSCVVHEGVTAVDLELDFTDSSGNRMVWTKTLDL